MAFRKVSVTLRHMIMFTNAEKFLKNFFTCLGCQLCAVLMSFYPCTVTPLLMATQNFGNGTTVVKPL